MSAKQEHESQHWENQCSTLFFIYLTVVPCGGKTSPGFPLRIKKSLSTLASALFFIFFKTSKTTTKAKPKEKERKKKKKQKKAKNPPNQNKVTWFASATMSEYQSCITNLTTTLKMAQVKIEWKSG